MQNEGFYGLKKKNRILLINENAKESYNNQILVKMLMSNTDLMYCLFQDICISAEFYLKLN